MNRRVILLCLVMFFTMLTGLVIRSEGIFPDRKDPSSLASPSREFDSWRRQWEKQR